MKMRRATALFQGRQAKLAPLFVVLALAFHCPHVFAAESIPIERYKKNSDQNIKHTNNTIEFYGLQISENNDDLIAYYNKKKVIDIGVNHLFVKKLNLKSAYIVNDYPQPGMVTLFVPIFTGGASCCSEDLLVTKTENGLSITTVHTGSGHGISADDIKNNKDLVVSNDCIQGVELHNVDPETFGWCRANAPRPEACLVFDNDAWRFARTAEKADQYEQFLRDEMPEVITKSAKYKLDDSYDRGMLYSDAATILYYSIMAGKSDGESSDLVKQIIPTLDAQKRKNFIGNIKETIGACRSIESQKIPTGQAVATNNAATSSSSPPKGNAASDGFETTPCGAIRDTKHRLEWLVGPDETLTYAQAKAWVHGVTACGTGWELPSIAQLASLFDARSTAGTGYVRGGKHWPAHINPLFAGIGRGSWVWSREEINANDAKSYNFNQGSETKTEKNNTEMTIRVFAVRKI